MNTRSQYQNLMKNVMHVIIQPRLNYKQLIVIIKTITTKKVLKYLKL